MTMPEPVKDAEDKISRFSSKARIDTIRSPALQQDEIDQLDREAAILASKTVQKPG